MPILRWLLHRLFQGHPGPEHFSLLRSYAMEKRLRKPLKRFGKGAIEGVAGPESPTTPPALGFHPVLTLEFRRARVMAVIVGALIIHGVTRPPVDQEQPGHLWGTIASMSLGTSCSSSQSALIGLGEGPEGPLRHSFPLILLFCFVGPMPTTTVWRNSMS